MQRKLAFRRFSLIDSLTGGAEGWRNGSTDMKVELRYAHDLILRVSDNGTGIDPVIVDSGKDGHFGLQGMRERAARIGGKFTLASSSQSGTEIELVVPANIIFRKTTLAHQTLFTKIGAFFNRIDRKSKVG